MSFGYFSYPLPTNEPVSQYAPGSVERATLLSLTGKKDNGLKINNTTSNLAHYKIEEQVRGN